MKARKSYTEIIGDHSFTSMENMTRAKAMAHDYVTEALTGSYAPHIITYRGNVAIMTREPGGWVYSIVWSRSNTEQLYPVIDDIQRLHTNNTPQSFDDCQRRMLNHLAQNAYLVGDVTAPDFIVGSEDRGDCEQYYQFQNLYNEALMSGKSDTACRAYAHGV